MQNRSDEPTRQASDEVRSEARDQQRGAERTDNQARVDLSQKAEELARDAKDALGKEADTVKEGIGSHLDALGGALNAAREHLDANGHSTASRFMGEASDGLGRLASSLHDKPLSEFLDDLRSAGRSNAGGLFAGAVLAGLALGRVLRASEGSSSSARNGANVGPGKTGSFDGPQNGAADPTSASAATTGYAP